VFENRALRGTKREKVREQGEIHDEALHNLYSSPNIIRMIQ
jgi:hypothetical protein